MQHRLLLLLSALGVGLAACTVGPNFSRPDPAVPTNWHDRSVGQGSDPAPVSQGTEPDPAWWKEFDDSELNELIESAIRGNPDLKQSVLRVVEARDMVVAARASGLPSLSGTGSYTREQFGARGLLESQGVYNDLNKIADPAVKNTVGGALSDVTGPVSLSKYGLDASWEIDLFGRIRRTVEQAKANAESSTEAANDALVTLEGEVGMSYAQLRGAQALSAAQQENIRTTHESLDLTERRRKEGLATDLDVEQARTQFIDAERQLPGYDAQVQEAKNQLSVLTGEPPGTLDAKLQKPEPLPRPPSVIGMGVPATLARRRPDIREAEASLHAATANTGVATAAFYPTLSLTGSAGLQALDARYLTNWASHFYSAGPGISLPIFQGGQLTANLHLARAEQEAAALKYRSTVLTALNEVENALVSYRSDREARDKLVELVQSADNTLRISRNRYDNGIASFLNVLSAQTSLTAARQQLVQAQMALTTDVVTLYKALGGGWQASDLTGTRVVDGTPPMTPAALDSLARGGAAGADL